MPKSLGGKARERVNLGHKDFKILQHITGYLESQPHTQEEMEKTLGFHLQLIFRLSISRVEAKEDN